MRFVTVMFAAAVFAANAAQAADKHDCYNVPYADDLSNITLGVVTAPKANFIANESDKAGCPSSSAACQRKAFVLSGNNVVIDKEGASSSFVCAAFVGARGQETDGWLPAASVKAVTAPPNWIGKWKRDTSANIEIKRKSASKAELSGDATWGQGEGTNVGDISADIDPRQTVQGFGTASDQQTQTAYGKGDKDACAVLMKQIGPYLFANDNNNCGGMNVTFGGIYVKR